MKEKECGNCQIGPNGGPSEIARPDIVCAIRMLAEQCGVRNMALKESRGFYCSAYHEYGTSIPANWGDEDEIS